MLNLYSIVEKDLALHFGQILQATEVRFTGSNNKEVVQKKKKKKKTTSYFLAKAFVLTRELTLWFT